MTKFIIMAILKLANTIVARRWPPWQIRTACSFNWLRNAITIRTKQFIGLQYFCRVQKMQYRFAPANRPPPCSKFNDPLCDCASSLPIGALRKITPREHAISQDKEFVRNKWLVATTSQFHCSTQSEVCDRLPKVGRYIRCTADVWLWVLVRCMELCWV